MDNPLEGPDGTRANAESSPGDVREITKDTSPQQDASEATRHTHENVRESSYQLQRLATGVAGLDTILRGGFLKGGLYLIIGEPGTGKTILANQLCFNHVADGAKGRRAVYVTLLVETHGRMLAHLSSLSFFDPAVVGQTLQYFSGAVILRENGLEELLGLLGRVIREHQATMLVVEGIETAQAVAESDLAFKQFLQSLQALIEIRDCTAFLVRQPLPADSSSAGYAVVDGLIELSDTRIGINRVRELEVLKLRGRDYLRDSHAFAITDAGIVVYPRTEKLVALLPPLFVGDRVDRFRLGFGTARLDDMMRGGPFVGSSTMVLGTPGSGKTVLGLHFLAAGARKGERGLYFGFDEPAELLIEKADKIGLGFSDHIASGLIDIVWQPPLDNILDALAERLLTLVRAHRVSRLFIDGLSGLERAVAYPERMFAFFAALMIQLRSLGVTTVFSTEMAQLFGPEVELPAAYASGTTDNILFLRYVELRSHLYRLISIMKMRDSAYEAAIREFIITEHGIEVAATFESAEAILTGLGRPIASGERPTPSTPVMPANPTSPSTPPATGVGSSLTTPESAPSAALDLQPSSPRSQTANAGPEVQTRDHLHRQPGQPGQLGQPGTDEEERGTDEGDQEGGGAEEIGG